MNGQSVLTKIRADLEGRLNAFKLPTILYILDGDQELPVTVSGKYLKRDILRTYFGSVDGVAPAKDRVGIERWDWKFGQQPTKAWDWGAMHLASTP